MPARSIAAPVLAGVEAAAASGTETSGWADHRPPRRYTTPSAVTESLQRSLAGAAWGSVRCAPMIPVASTFYGPRSESAPQPVLILCADGGITGELIRDLAGRHYQPLVGRPDWSWQTSLEWARPVAAVVDRSHPAARSDAFLAASDVFQVGVVMFGGSADVPPRVRNSSHAAPAPNQTIDVEVIGGAVDAAVRRRSARDD